MVAIRRDGKKRLRVRERRGAGVALPSSAQLDLVLPSTATPPRASQVRTFSSCSSFLFLTIRRHRVHQPRRPKYCSALHSLSFLSSTLDDFDLTTTAHDERK